MNGFELMQVPTLDTEYHIQSFGLNSLTYNRRNRIQRSETREWSERV